MERKPTRAEKIFYALMNNYKANGQFMNAMMLAKTIHSDSYSKRTGWILEKGIRNSMSDVEKIAIENDFILIKKKKPTKHNPKKGHIILGWKLALKGFDEDYVIEESISKSDRATSYRNAARRYLNAAEKNELISPEKCKELDAKFNENIQLIIDLLAD